MDHKICCICGVMFTEYGNNPAPFEGDRCCNDCDNRWVIPARILRIDDDAMLKILETIAKLGRSMLLSKEMLDEEMRKERQGRAEQKEGQAGFGSDE